MACWAVIMNPVAGPRNSGPAELVRQFDARGIAARLLTTSPSQGASQLARRAAEEGFDAIIAAGGDGTANAVASQLVGSGVPFGVLPLGTMNYLAKNLSMPVDGAGAIEALAAAPPRPMDVGEINGRIFLNGASLGLYPRLMRHRERLRHGPLGHPWTVWPAALFAALRALPMLRMHIEADGLALHLRTPLVYVTNNAYQLEAVGLAACHEPGKLSVVAAHRTGRLRILWLAIRAALGTLSGSNDLSCTPGEHIEITGPRRHWRVDVDGEVVMLDNPLRITLRREGLRVLAPHRTQGPPAGRALP